MLKWGICGFGALLAILGLVWGISGWSVVEMERGWSSVLAGAMVFGAGSIILAIAGLMHRIEELIGELHGVSPRREAEPANEVPSARPLPQVHRPAEAVPVQQSFDSALAEAEEVEKTPETSPGPRPQGRPAFVPPRPPPGMDVSSSSRKPAAALSESLPPGAVASAAGAAAIESALLPEAEAGSLARAQDEAPKSAVERPQLGVIGGRLPEEQPTQVSQDVETSQFPATVPVAPRPREPEVAEVPRISVPPLAPLPPRAAWPKPPAGVAWESEGAMNDHDGTAAPAEAQSAVPAAPTAPVPNMPIPNLPLRPSLPPDIRRIPATAPSLPAAAIAPVAEAAPLAAAPVAPASMAAAQELHPQSEKDAALPVTAGDGMVDNEAPVAVSPPPLPASTVAPPPYQGSAWVDKLFAELDDIAEPPAGAGSPPKAPDMIGAANMAREIESESLAAQEDAEDGPRDVAVADDAPPSTPKSSPAEATEPPAPHYREPAPAEGVPTAALQPADSEPTPERVLLRSYQSQGVDYHLYEDGSIDAETSGGTFRFASLEELRQFIEKRSG